MAFDCQEIKGLLTYLLTVLLSSENIVILASAVLSQYTRVTDNDDNDKR